MEYAPIHVRRKKLENHRKWSVPTHDPFTRRETRAHSCLFSRGSINGRPLSPGPSARVDVPRLAGSLYCGGNRRVTPEQTQSPCGLGCADPGKWPAQDRGRRPLGRKLGLKIGAEWDLVPGHHLSETVQRDLEAVIASAPWSARRGPASTCPVVGHGYPRHRPPAFGLWVSPSACGNAMGASRGVATIPHFGLSHAESARVVRASDHQKTTTTQTVPGPVLTGKAA